VQGQIDEAGSGPRRAVPAAHRAAAGGPAAAAANGAPPGQTAPARRGLPPLRMVGQLHRTFIIAEGEQGLVLVDQHAAHERVVYERLLAAKGAGERARQPLLDPPVLELGAAEAAVWSESGPELAALGFELDEWGEGALRLRAVPACSGPDGLSTADAERWLREVLSELGGAERGEARFDRAGAFTYSPQPGTPAADLDGQIAERTKQRRYRRLMTLLGNIAAERSAEQVGRELQLLVESEPGQTTEDGAPIFAGRSYREAPEVDGLIFCDGAAPPGSMPTVRISAALGHDLWAEPLAEER